MDVASREGSRPWAGATPGGDFALRSVLAAHVGSSPRTIGAARRPYPRRKRGDVDSVSSTVHFGPILGNFEGGAPVPWMGSAKAPSLRWIVALLSARRRGRGCSSASPGTPAVDVVCTVPADVPGERRTCPMPSQRPSSIEAPLHSLSLGSLGVRPSVFCLNWRPRLTQLLKPMRARHCCIVRTVGIGNSLHAEPAATSQNDGVARGMSHDAARAWRPDCGVLPYRHTVKEATRRPPGVIHGLQGQHVVTTNGGLGLLPGGESYHRRLSVIMALICRRRS